MMKWSSAFPMLENLHLYKKEGKDCRVRLELFVLWVLGITSIFTLFIFYSPNPFNGNPLINNLNEKDVLLQPKEENTNGEKKCDLFKGRWIRDFRGSLYTNYSCPLMPDSKNCAKYGKNNVDYLNWRWKPDECDIQKFDPKTFLSIVRGKRLAFIGDSVARNQMDSLLCLLSQEEIPKDIYKDSEDRFRTFYFPSHNFTLMVYWVKFLVIGEERVINGSNSGFYDIHLDKVEETWSKKIFDLDYAIISDAHWFFRKTYLYESGKIVGCIYCDEPEIPNLEVQFVIKRVFRTALEFINGCKNCRDLVTLVRTFSPSHFENGGWNGGGNCNRTSPYSEDEIKFGGTEWEIRNNQVKEVERIQGKIEKGRRKRFEVLDVTRVLMMRPDGHPGSNWNNKFMKGYNDCIHWCLPGPIDVMNEFLMVLLHMINGGSSPSLRN